MPAASTCKRTSAPTKQSHSQASVRSPKQKGGAKRQVEESTRIQDWRRRLRSIANVQIGGSDGSSTKRRRASAGVGLTDVSDVATPADLEEMRALLREGEAAGLEEEDLEQLRRALEMEETKAEVAEAARLADLNEATSDINTLRAVIQEGKAVGLEAAELKDARRALAKGVSKAKLASADLDALRTAARGAKAGLETAASSSSSSASAPGNDVQDNLPAVHEEIGESTSEALVLANMLEEAAAKETAERSMLASPGSSLLEAAMMASRLEASAPASLSPASSQHGRTSVGAESASSDCASAPVPPAMPTNSEQIAEFNRTFQVAMHSEPRTEVFTKDVHFANQQIDLVLEEARELETGKARKSLPDVARALANLVYTAYSVGLSMGVNVDDAFRAVHASNMSTLCTSEAEAEETAAWHRSQCPKGCPPPPLAVLQADDGQRWKVQNTRTGEVLRSVRWQPVDLGLQWRA